MKKLFILLAVLLSITASSQTTGIKITEMPTYAGDPAGAFVPVVLNGANRKVDGNYFGYRKVDNIWKSNDTLYFLKAGITYGIKLSTGTEADPVFIAHVAHAITGTDTSHWNIAYRKRASAVNITGGTTKTFSLTLADGSVLSKTFKTDSVFLAHVASSITSTDITRWNAITSADSLEFTTGLQRTGDVVAALYNSDIWNAGKFKGRYLSDQLPTNGQIYVYDSIFQTWTPTTLLGSGVMAPYKLNGDSVHTTASSYVRNDRLKMVNDSTHSKRIIYASVFGAKLDLNKTTRTGTNDLAILQRAVDTLTARGGGTLIIDGDALIGSTLVVKSNVKIVNMGTVMLADNSNCHMLTSVLTGATISNYNLEITGGVWDGNWTHQNRWETADSTHMDVHMLNVGFWIGSVQNYSIHDIEVKNSTTWSILVSHAYDGVIKNAKSYWVGQTRSTIATGYIGKNHDGIHMWGKVDRLYIDGYKSNGDDDVLAFNTNENFNNGMGHPELPVDVRRGANTGGIQIQNVTATNIFCDSSANSIRFIGYNDADATFTAVGHNNPQLIENIKIENISGYVTFLAPGWSNINAHNLEITGWRLKGTTGWAWFPEPFTEVPTNEINIDQFNNEGTDSTTTIYLNDIAEGTPVKIATAVRHKFGNYFTRNVYQDPYTNLTNVKSGLHVTGHLNVDTVGTGAGGDSVLVIKNNVVKKVANITTTVTYRPLGGGTTNYLPKWVNDSLLTNSSIIDDGTHIGIKSNGSPDRTVVMGDGTGSPIVEIYGGTGSALLMHDAAGYYGVFGNEAAIVGGGSSNNAMFMAYSDEVIFQTAASKAVRFRTNGTNSAADRLIINPDGSSTFTGNIVAPAPTYSTGGYTTLGRNATTGRLESVPTPSSYTASNGLTLASGDFKFGGSLTANTSIDMGVRTLSFTRPGTTTGITFAPSFVDNVTKYDATHITEIYNASGATAAENYVLLSAQAGSDSRTITVTPTYISFGSLSFPEYTDNATALAGGLAAGYLYRTGDILKIVH